MLPTDKSRRYDEIYERKPPWDINRPQPEIASLVQKGFIKGRVLDVGCGTGENALFLAKMGYQVTGIDISSKAIEIAKDKAKKRKLRANFVVGNALALRELSDHFNTIIDVGFFHVLSDEDRQGYVKELVSVSTQDSVYHVICFSDKEPGTWGPRRVSKHELIETFTKDNSFQVIEIVETDFKITLPNRGNIRALRGSFQRFST